MAPKDKEKTAFMTDKGTFYYKVIPFSMKNIGAIYKKMVTKIFKELIGRNMKVYMDDMLIKSLSFKQHLRNLEEVFTILRKYQIKLN